ncbi:MAG: hypothetical protein JSR17_10050 [Proteobacteria bacterium]|nr:hypothetical protein [Pseudomonadota bacterium]
MKLLTASEIQHISGAGSEFNKAGYEANAMWWSLIGTCTAAVSLSLIPEPYGAYFAVKMAAISAGGVAGYVAGAVGYSATQAIQTTLDTYLAPAE